MMQISAVSFLFSIFVVSLLSTKLLTLGSHFTSISLLSFILYLPTFFLLDVLAICVVRLCFRREKGILQWIAFFIGLILT